MLKLAITFICTGMAAMATVLPARAETPLEKALATGQLLSSDEISAKIVDHTITARKGQRTFVFYYGPDNKLTGRMVGGKWSDSGYYGITDGGKVCLSMTPDKGRLRCMTLVATDGVVKKFDEAGELTFELLSFEAGNRL
jgi:hypothetical protein